MSAPTKAFESSLRGRSPGRTASALRRRHGESRRASASGLTLSLLAASPLASPTVLADHLKVRRFADQGYIPEEFPGVATTFSAWVEADGTFDVSLTFPTSAGLFPLVVYLPGFGEMRTAGELWRTAWAHAGYAVLTVQPHAGNGSGVVVAGATEAGARLDTLARLLSALRRRHQSGEAPLDRADLARVALVGYGLGAATALSLAAEVDDGSTAPALPVAIGAVIALAAESHDPTPAIADRYRGIRSPLLAVTCEIGERGGPPPAPACKAAFRQMPTGDKYLLNLRAVSQCTLSGSECREASAPPVAAGDEADPPIARAIAVAAVRAVTTAFLDACLQKDPDAQAWLVRDARRWLRERAEFRRR